jgi:hypothetical protein
MLLTERGAVLEAPFAQVDAAFTAGVEQVARRYLGVAAAAAPPARRNIPSAETLVHASAVPTLFLRPSIIIERRGVEGAARRVGLQAKAGFAFEVDCVIVPAKCWMLGEACLLLHLAGRLIQWDRQRLVPERSVPP